MADEPSTVSIKFLSAMFECPNGCSSRISISRDMAKVSKIECPVCGLTIAEGETLTDLAADMQKLRDAVEAIGNRAAAVGCEITIRAELGKQMEHGSLWW